MILEQLKAEEAKLKKELKAVRKRIKKATHEDGWYTDSYDNLWFMYIKDGCILFGVDCVGKWFCGNRQYDIQHDDYLATPKEVTARLTEFVKSLGYDEGVKVNDCRGYGEYTIGMQSLEFLNDYDSTDFCILFGGGCVWSSNKGWAKIIEAKPKYTVKPSKFGYDGNEVFSDFTILKDGGMILGDECEQIAKQIENFLNTES